MMSPGGDSDLFRGMVHHTTGRRLPLPCIPVLLIHSEDPAGSGLAACCGYSFRVPEDDEFPGVARQSCPGCFLVATRWKVAKRES